MILIILIFIKIPFVYSYLYFNCTTENETNVQCQYWSIKSNCDKCYLDKIIGTGDNTYCICYYPFTTNYSSNFNCSQECGFICTNFCDLNIGEDTYDTDDISDTENDTYDTEDDTYDTENDTYDTENDTYDTEDDTYDTEDDTYDTEDDISDTENVELSRLEGTIIVITVSTFLFISACCFLAWTIFFYSYICIRLLKKYRNKLSIKRRKKCELKLTDPNDDSVDKIMDGEIELEDLERKCESNNTEEENNIELNNITTKKTVPVLINNLIDSDLFLEKKKKKRRKKREKRRKKLEKKRENEKSNFEEVFNSIKNKREGKKTNVL